MTALTNIKVWDQEYKNVDSVQYNYAKSEEKEHWELDRPISQFWLYLLTDFVSQKNYFDISETKLLHLK